MPIYARKVDSSNDIFKNRQNVVAGGGVMSVISVPDSVTLCNGCNGNISEGYLIYLDEDALRYNRPYDYYCESCMYRLFKKVILVTQ